MNLKKLTLLCACVLSAAVYASDKTEETDKPKDPSTSNAAVVSDIFNFDKLTRDQKIEKLIKLEIPPCFFEATHRHYQSLEKILAFPDWAIGIFKGIYNDDTTLKGAFGQTILAASRVQLLTDNLRVKYLAAEKPLDDPSLAKIVFHPNSNELINKFNEIMANTSEVDEFTNKTFAQEVNLSILLFNFPGESLNGSFQDYPMAKLKLALAHDDMDSLCTQIKVIMEDNKKSFIEALKKALDTKKLS